jgi:hypothetical protein
MVSHEHPSVNLPAVAGANLPQSEHERFEVIIGLKHYLAAVTAGLHVVDSPRILETGRRAMPLLAGKRFHRQDQCESARPDPVYDPIYAGRVHPDCLGDRFLEPLRSMLSMA